MVLLQQPINEIRSRSSSPWNAELVEGLVEKARPRFSLRLLLLGDAFVGKTTLVSMFSQTSRQNSNFTQKNGTITHTADKECSEFMFYSLCHACVTQVKLFDTAGTLVSYRVQ